MESWQVRVSKSEVMRGVLHHACMCVHVQMGVYVYGL